VPARVVPKLTVPSAVRSLRNGAFTTRVTVTGPGRVAQIGLISTTRAAGRAKAKAICSVNRRVTKAGAILLVCTLTPGAQALRRQTMLHVDLITTFTPVGGKTISSTRRITLPRLAFALPSAVTG